MLEPDLGGKELIFFNGDKMIELDWEEKNSFCQSKKLNWLSQAAKIRK